MSTFASAKKAALAIFAVTSIAIFFITSMSLQRSLPTRKNKEIVRNAQSSKLSQAIANVPIGSLGPKGTDRRHKRYYDSLFFTALQFGQDASSLIEVGCSSDPFIQFIGWIDKKTCVAPYFIQYKRGVGIDNSTMISNNDAIEKVTADFMEYNLTDYSYDLLVCSQVLEHVPDPSAFMKKLIRSARTSIISVPYMWPDCGKTCSHVTHYISYKKILEWSKPHVPISSVIINEKSSEKFGKRIIVVFRPYDE